MFESPQNTYDIIIVGAGLSGIGTACHLQGLCPTKRFAILESRGAIGGTWDLFRYPGIRSDSDMHTLGYSFKPWLQAEAIADGPSILQYVNETAREHQITEHVLFKHRVVSADWSSQFSSWSLAVEVGAKPEVQYFRCNVLLMCGGYYDFDTAYDPGFTTLGRFGGTVAHPQFWPENMEYRGKRVVVIGSGATAMTIVPTMAQKGAMVTMVQRSPTYVVSQPREDAIANFLGRWLPARWAYFLTRWKNIVRDLRFYRQTRIKPDKIKADLVGAVRDIMGPDYDVGTHFTPSYGPWDQRLCLIPDDDLFHTLKDGSAKVVTGLITEFTPHGLKLGNGKQIEADIIVTATGLQLTLLSNVKFTVDHKSVRFADTFTYKGMMFSDVPNLVQTFGYVNASWTLRTDLTAEFACRLVNRMDELNMGQCTPRLRVRDKGMREFPWISNFSAGYIQRFMDDFPKQGDREPWVHTQDYFRDRRLISKAPIDDDVLCFSHSRDG